ncbi:hypothetical protein [Tunturiibacter gelidoferens]|uniref:Uncharacterized protein n=1 Tax=Tunturiibacter lichenicola TaxID=2051959 RepID=A0A7Y9T4V1_9BACT|nr:hypothetical protein [Edaphobacter lichenicola]NYF53921.1 hypothetical protein [Edaphobacter lichenicola]
MTITKELHKTLIAKWTMKQAPRLKEPYSVGWEDGSPATLQDYRKHAEDTYSLVSNRAQGFQEHIFPGIVGEVRFETNVGDWVVRGPGVVTAALDVKNPDAPDDEIYAAIATFPVVYKVRIIRS